MTIQVHRLHPGSSRKAAPQEQEGPVSRFRNYKPRPIEHHKTAVQRLFRQVGPIEEAAAILQRSPSRLYAYEDPSEKAEITLAQIVALTRPGVDAIAEFLAHRAGGQFLPLPPDLFPCFAEARRSVHRDAYIEVQKAFYHVPPEYIGRTVWARWDNRCVRIFNQRWEQVCLHTRLEPGQFTKVKGIGGGAGSLEQNISYWLRRAGELAGWLQNNQIDGKLYTWYSHRSLHGTSARRPLTPSRCIFR